MKLRQILLIGGCGFLGQYLTNDLINKFPDLKIKILDLRLNPYSLFDFSDNSNVEILLQKNICDYNSIKNEFKNIDGVIHLAGIVSCSLKDRELLENVNVQGTKNLLKVSNENKIKLFLHISSVAALGYNDDRDRPIDETFDFDWNIAKSKKKYYMLTKHLADVEVRKYRKNGLDAIILYPGLMFGPGDIKNSSRLIRAIKDRRIPFNMPGGTNVIDVRDVCKGIVAALKKGMSNGDYLLSGYNITFREINRIIAKELGVKPPKLTLPKILNSLVFNLMSFIELKAKNKLELTTDNVDSGFKFKYFDNSKAKNELGWEPKIKFEQTIKDTIKWLNKNDEFKK